MIGPSEGEAAPLFVLPDQHGRRVTLESFRGRSAVLVVFVPTVFSPVCTSELQDIRDQWAELQRSEAEVLGISTDPMFALRGFSDLHGLEMPLLSDFWPHGAVSTAYGVFDGALGSSRRTSVLVDAAGVVRWRLDSPMPQARPVAAHLAAVGALKG